ncbi:zinc finger protein 664-like [Drosophila yakuba]|uniref:zinc finger protein 664-like n=1 Tax=Drosophila yakuba TaxID=7245 RepID=UPI00193080E8|nr:zinc finger protein 664-like [Drosophila yakuba]
MKAALKDRCRVCLGVSEKMVNIFERKQEDLRVSIAHMISECTGCDIKEGDTFSELICPPCLEDAQSAFDIIGTYERSYRIFCEAQDAVLEEDFLDGEVYTISDSESGTSHDADGKQKCNYNADEIYEISEDECDRTVGTKPEDSSQQLDKSESKEGVLADKKVEDIPQTATPASADQLSETDTKKLYSNDNDCRARKTYKCSYCSKSFPNRSSFEAHNRIHTGERPFKCPSCPLSFRLKSFLVRHAIRHSGERPFKCDICGKSFLGQSNLYHHKKIHSDIRPYVCASCPKAFRFKNHLERHTRNHMGVRPFKCDYCGKNFATRGNLDCHIRTHTGERPFECSICHSAFLDLSNLTAHIRIHSNERPFKCDNCDKRFLNKYRLAAHKLTHSVERPYKCPDCQSSFSTPTSLYHHRNLHMPKGPFKCEDCGLALKNISLFRRHVKSHGKNVFKFDNSR